MIKDLSHIDESGKASMVDVSQKNKTHRVAVATGKVIFPAEVFETLMARDFLSDKGNIVQTAIIAGIQATKKTADLIPLCHPLALSNIQIDIDPNEDHLKIVCRVSCNERTGVEMEALTGVSISALTVYDMCKALSHEIKISEIQLIHKSGGKHEFNR